MGLAALINRLERDNDARVAEVRADAERRVEAVRAAAEAELARLRDASLREHEQRLRREVQGGLQDARAAALRQVLNARQALFERIFERARLRLGEVSTVARHRRRLTGELRRALSFIGDREAVIRCPEELAAIIRQVVSGVSTVSVVATPDAPPGFSIQTTDERVRVDATLTSRLDRRRPQLAIALLRRLEGR